MSLTPVNSEESTHKIQLFSEDQEEESSEQETALEGEEFETKPLFDELNASDKLKKIFCNEPDCHEKFKFIKLFREHLEKEHMFEMVCEKASFRSIEEFEKWRSDYEHEHCCSFVKKTGSRSTSVKKHVSTYLYCSRGGIHEHRKGIKFSRKSIKSGTACTASIMYKELPHGEITMTFYPIHYGHELDVARPRLSKQDKWTIVNELSEDKSPTTIVDQMRASACSGDVNSSISRTLMISKTDVMNAGRKLATGLGGNSSGISVPCMENDFQSLDVWCAELSSQNCRTSPVIYYKPLGYKSESLSSYDLCLILMTEHMRKMLTFFGDNLIYVSSLTIPKIQYHVTFLFILDEFNTPFPVFLMVSNKINNTYLRVMFETLRSDLKTHQISLQTKVLMTDRNDVAHLTWSEVMKTPSKHMICPRFIDNEWRKYLATISNEEFQDEIYDQLCELLEPKERDAQESLVKVLNKLESNEMCAKFLTYFKKFYAHSFDEWGGHSLRTILNIHSSLNFEKTLTEIQETLDAKYKKYARNIVKMIQQLFRRIVSYQYARTSSITAIRSCIENHHRSSLSMDLKSVYRTENENEWQVVLDTKETVSKTKHPPKCCQSDDWECSIICSVCAICLHEYVCTCFVYSRQATICVHIHLVVRMMRHALLSNVLEKNYAVLHSRDIPDKPDDPLSSNEQVVSQDVQDETSIRKAIIQSLNNTQDKLYLIQDEDKLRALLNIARELHSLTCEMHSKNLATKSKTKCQKKVDRSPVTKKTPKKICALGDSKENKNEINKEENRETPSNKETIIKVEPGEIRNTIVGTGENVLHLPSQNIEVFLNENKSPVKQKTNESRILPCHKESGKVIKLHQNQGFPSSPVDMKLNPNCKSIINSNVHLKTNKTEIPKEVAPHEVKEPKVVNGKIDEIQVTQADEETSCEKIVNPAQQCGEPMTKPSIDTEKKPNKPIVKTLSNASTITSWDIEIAWLNKKILIPLFNDPKTGIEKIIQKLNAGHFVYKNEKDKRGDIISTNKPSIIDQLSNILKSLQNPKSTISSAKPAGPVTVKLLEHREPLTLKRKIEEYSQQIHIKKENDVLVVNETDKRTPVKTDVPPKKLKLHESREIETVSQLSSRDNEEVDKTDLGIDPNVEVKIESEATEHAAEVSPPVNSGIIDPEKTIPRRVVRTLRPEIQNKFNSPPKGCLKVLKPCIK